MEVGAITGSHGLKGALTLFSHTRPAIGIAGYSFWWVGDSPETAVSYRVERCWSHGGSKLLAKLEGVDDCNGAEALKKSTIWVNASEVELEDDEYLWEELTGYRVVTTDGVLLGTVTGMAEFGAQDNFCVATPDNSDEPGEWLLPFIGDVVVAINDESRTIEVELLEGMDACFTPRS
ncbi:MAG: ribosome maturation factor RimM [Mariprofundaceae bacterium]|nr:ribosome maturation factor RimM [Mariprofundaceae bacterium]